MGAERDGPSRGRLARPYAAMAGIPLLPGSRSRERGHPHDVRQADRRQPPQRPPLHRPPLPPRQGRRRPEPRPPRPLLRLPRHPRHRESRRLGAAPVQHRRQLRPRRPARDRPRRARRPHPLAPQARHPLRARHHASSHGRAFDDLNLSRYNAFAPADAPEAVRDRLSRARARLRSLTRLVEAPPSTLVARAAAVEVIAAVDEQLGAFDLYTFCVPEVAPDDVAWEDVPEWT